MTNFDRLVTLQIFRKRVAQKIYNAIHFKNNYKININYSSNQ